MEKNFPSGLKRNLPVFYDPRQTAARNESISPSAGKPALVVADWISSGFPLDIRSFPPLSPEELSLAHDPDYVRGVLACERPNGFGNTLREVADALPWTTGSMTAAAEYAAVHGGFAASPSSGFHHAEYGSGAGFCTFNGLALAVLILRARGLAKRIGILDIDMHYGNGTVDILKRKGLSDDTPHYTFGGDPFLRMDRGFNGERWLARLPRVLESFSGCDMLLYQAGADPHVNDPLGGALTTEQLRERDRVVFRTCAAMGLPVAWNLAGGYQRPIDRVLEIHRNTMSECLAALRTYTDGQDPFATSSSPGSS